MQLQKCFSILFILLLNFDLIYQKSGITLSHVGSGGWRQWEQVGGWLMKPGCGSDGLVTWGQGEVEMVLSCGQMVKFSVPLSSSSASSA